MTPNTGLPVIAIAGPTASGKSSLAVSLAQAIGGEVLSGDAMQIYRGMDIGTAKLTEKEKMGVPHHLLDLRDPDESFSVAAYQGLARTIIEDLLRQAKTPVLAGGSGLYMDSVLYPYEYKAESMDAISRGAEPLPDPSQLWWKKLKEIDPVSAERLHPNDTKRIIRALQYAEAHGSSISLNTAARVSQAPVYPLLWIGLNLPRLKLYQRIDERVDKMMEAGLLLEVLHLRDRGLTLETQAGQAIGYKQLLQSLEGSFSLEEAVERIKRDSRRYAKRQLTWFRRNWSIVWLDGEKLTESSNQRKLIAILKDMVENGSTGALPISLADRIQTCGLSYQESREEDL
ncbi:MAG: tRNA (adenosine(37)-N6)-dimethylallyltransferase MiaA [Clostridiales bacterium]|nr:tRNA (adenosine(37)-N6)-dimethylallyltransferase MiaA [Clostridiales bacterium]